MANTFAEYREVSVAEPLRQGDILEAVEASVEMWQRHLLVITADCDFAHDKHQGRVTCVPLLTSAEYLVEMQLPKLRDRMVSRPLARLQEHLRTSGGYRLGVNRLREWISEEESEAVLSTLGVDRSTPDIEAAILSVRMIDSPSSSLDKAIENLVQAQLLDANPPKRENAIKTVIGPLRACYSKPPGDALFLGTIGPTYDAGYFVYLRHLEQVLEIDISTVPGRREVRYRRISRLRDRFIHAVVQRFAMVYMSIGLPKEYEDMRDLHSELLGEAFE